MPTSTLSDQNRAENTDTPNRNDGVETVDPNKQRARMVAAGGRSTDGISADRNPSRLASRRTLLRAGASTGAMLATGAIFGQLKAAEDAGDSTAKLKLRVAGYQYDRVAGLEDGRVQIEGCETQFEIGKIGDMNTHVLSGPKSREVSEIGLMPFMLAYAKGGFRDYSLIPVFPFRAFRHKSIFIRNDRGIEKPADLRGRKVATPGYSSTSLTWIRGLMEHEYGVKPDEIRWVVSDKDSGAASSGVVSEFENVLPANVSVEKGPAGKDESEMLVDGDVDALFHALEPKAFREGHPNVARLFADSRNVEQAYFAKTGFFPIMHAVAIRNDLIDANPWLPKAVFDAYSEAKQLSYNFLNDQAWAMTSLPWVVQDIEETRRLMGDNYWPYGMEPNRKTLEALFQYAHEQGLTKRKLTIEELFHRSTLDLREDRPVAAPVPASADPASATPASAPKTTLSGQPNFRDLGGYKTTDGRTVKPGLVFRSGELPKLTDRDVETLRELGIKTVVNFLTDTEIAAHGSDRLPANAKTVQLPIAGGQALGGGMAGAILRARQTADFSKVPVEINPELHRLLIREGKVQFAAFLRQLADPAKRPLVLHCSHGVHRTGTASAILLSALGVPWETVREDYLLSNDFRKEEVQGRLNQLRNQAAEKKGIRPEEVDMANINAFYILQPSYIDASRDEAVKQYGSMGNYIRKGLGVEDEVIRQLRDVLLQ